MPICTWAWFRRNDPRGMTPGLLWISRRVMYWYMFFNGTLAAALNLGGTFSSTPLDMSYTARAGGLVIYKVSVSFIPTRNQYITRLEIHNNPGVIPLGSLRLNHAQVQIGIGDAPENALR